MRIAQSVYLLAFVGLLSGCASSQPLARSSELSLKPDHATALVVDLDRAVAWYTSILGLKVRERGAHKEAGVEYAELSMPGYGIGLVRLAASSSLPAGTLPLAPSWLHIVFSVPDLEQAGEILEMRGAPITTRKSDGVLRSLLIHDSEGNEIEFVSAHK